MIKKTVSMHQWPSSNLESLIEGFEEDHDDKWTILKKTKGESPEGFTAFRLTPISIRVNSKL